MVIDESEVCTCQCVLHGGADVHMFECCVPCPFCSKNIKYMKHSNHIEKHMKDSADMADASNIVRSSE